MLKLACGFLLCSLVCQAAAQAEDGQPIWSPMLEPQVAAGAETPYDPAKVVSIITNGGEYTTTNLIVHKINVTEDCAFVHPACYYQNPDAYYFQTRLVEPAPCYPMDYLQTKVAFGRVPPKMRYFSVEPFMFNHTYPGDKEPTDIWIGLSDTLNNFRMKVFDCPDHNNKPWGCAFIVVFAPDDFQGKKILQKLQAVYKQVNYIPLPSKKLTMGWTKLLDPSVDKFNLMFRTAPRPENKTAVEAWLASKPIQTLLATPTRKSIPRPYGLPDYIPMKFGKSESHLSPSLDSLEQAVLSNYTARGFLSDAAPQFSPHLEYSDLFASNYQNGWTCFDARKLCEGDNRDTIYIKTRTPLLLADDDLIVIIGVNHYETGKAVYTSLSSYNAEHKLGMGSSAVDNLDMPNSTLDFVPRDSQTKYLYAWKFARKCGGEPHCFEIGSVFPSGLPYHDHLVVVERIYVDPATTVRPDPSSLVMPRVFRFKRPQHA